MVELNFNLLKISKKLFIIIILVYLFLSIHLTKRISSEFYRDFTTLLPTTSHIKGLNLKYFQPEILNDQKIIDLRSQLSKQFPYIDSKPIPRIVWQTWKDRLDSENVPKNFLQYSNEWIEMTENSGMNFRYNLITDEQILPFLRQFYGSVPQIIQAFNSMPTAILKADFFRYLVLYAQGGIYSDIDTFPLKPLNSWPSLNHTLRKTFITEGMIPYQGSGPNQEISSPDPGFIVGIEADPDRPDWSEWYARRIQFCQWTIQAKPGHPILRELIINITSTTLYSSDSLLESNNAPLFEIDNEFKDDYNVNMRHRRFHNKKYSHHEKKNEKNTDGTDIMNWTGPGLFSDIIFQYIDNLIQTNDNVSIYNQNILTTMPSEDEDNSTKKFSKYIYQWLQKKLPKFHWGFFSLITAPVIIDDILILPITSFSPDVGQMGAEPSNHKFAYVKHMFEGSWKPEDK